MTTTLIVVLVLVLLAAAATAVYLARRSALRRRFGPEYDRTVEGSDDRLTAERELRSRERRHAQLELRPLDEAARERFAEQWRAVQTQFVLDPAGAVVAGDELVTKLVTEGGYPTTGHEDPLSYRSATHARHVS